MYSIDDDVPHCAGCSRRIEPWVAQAPDAGDGLCARCVDDRAPALEPDFHLWDPGAID